MTHAEEIVKKAEAIFKENHSYYGISINDTHTAILQRIDICVDGDWKHDHGYVDYVMQELGCLKVDEWVHYNTGDDWYPSTHTFVCVKDLSVIPSGQTEIGFLETLRKMFS